MARRHYHRNGATMAVVLDSLNDLACPYCTEALEAFAAEPEMVMDGDRVVAFKVICSKCGATATFGAESLVRGPIVRVMH